MIDQTSEEKVEEKTSKAFKKVNLKIKKHDYAGYESDFKIMWNTEDPNMSSSSPESREGATMNVHGKWL